MRVVMKRENRPITPNGLERGKMYTRVGDPHELLLVAAYSTASYSCLVNLVKNCVVPCYEIPSDDRFIELEGYYVTNR